jgi:exosortase
LKAAGFPLLFLLLAIPIPVGIVEKISAALQAGSTEIAHGLFKLLGIPVFREGFAFSLPGVNIEVGEECSGIRSSIALVITGILAGHVFLRSRWTKVCLVVFSAFVAVFKNAVRIVFLSAMTAYSNQDFLNSRLHHQYGGLAFSCFALAMVVPFIFLLRKVEGRTR